jgi:hypothetical protein
MRDMLHWLNHNAAAVQAAGTIASVFVTLMLAWITRRYVSLTQDLAIAAREQLRFQQQTERSGAAQLLTLTEVFLSHLRRLPTQERDASGLKRATLWKHSDVTTFSTLAASVLGSSDAVQRVIEGLTRIAAQVEHARADGELQFQWKEWSVEIEKTRKALHAIRSAAEEAEAHIVSNTENAPLTDVEQRPYKTQDRPGS